MVAPAAVQHYVRVFILPQPKQGRSVQLMSELTAEHLAGCSACRRKKRTMKKTRRRSGCPVACTLDLIGDRWTLLIIRDLLLGKTHYREFARSPERIATNILADRLERLQDVGLVTTEPSTLRVGSRAYTLTSKGESLLPLLEAMREWGIENVAGTDPDSQPQTPH